MKLHLSLLIFAHCLFAQISYYPSFGLELNEGQYPAAVKAVWVPGGGSTYFVTQDGLVRSQRTSIRWRGVTPLASAVGIPRAGHTINRYLGSDTNAWRANRPNWEGVKLGAFTANGALASNAGDDVTLHAGIDPSSLGGVRVEFMTLTIRLRPGVSLDSFGLEVLGWNNAPSIAPGRVGFTGGETPGVFWLIGEATQMVSGQSVAVPVEFVAESSSRFGLRLSNPNPAYESTVSIRIPYGGAAFGRPLPPKSSDGARYAFGTIDRGNRTGSPFPGSTSICESLCEDAWVSRVGEGGETIWMSVFGGSKTDRAVYSSPVAGGIAVVSESSSQDFPLTGNAPVRSLGGDSGVALLYLDSATGQLRQSTYAGGGWNAWLSQSVTLENRDLLLALGALAPAPHSVVLWRPEENRFVYRNNMPGGTGALAPLTQGRVLLASRTENGMEILALTKDGELESRKLEVLPSAEFPQPVIADPKLWTFADGTAAFSYQVYSRDNSYRRVQIRLLSFTQDLQRKVFDAKLSDSGALRDLGRTLGGNWKMLIRSAYPLEPTTRNAALVAGCTESEYFKLLSPAGETRYASFVPPVGFDFQAAVEPSGPGARSIACVSNSAGRRLNDYVAPGQLMTITGGGFGPESVEFFSPGPDGKYPTSAAGFRVRIQGIDAPLIAVARGLLAVQVPYELDMTTTAAKRVEFFEGNEPTLEFEVRPVSYQFAFFDSGSRLNPSGLPVLAALNEDGSVNSAANPARPGSHVSLFGSGLGRVNPELGTGGLNPVPPVAPLSGTHLLSRAFGGTITYLGSAPGLSTGVSQVNIRLPDEIPGTGLRLHELGLVLGEAIRQLIISGGSGVVYVK